MTSFISRPGEVVVVKRIEMAARKMKPIPIFNLLELKIEGEETEEEIENDYIEEIPENLDEVDNIPY